MKSFCIYVFVLLPFISFSQINTPQLISNSGGSFSSGGYHIDFSVGEIATEQFGNGVVLTQGFHQGDLSIVTDVEELDFISKIYPNPTQSFFTIEFDSPQNVTAFLSDQNGKLIFRKEIKNQSTQTFDVSTLAQGNYQFVVINTNNKRFSFTLNKLR